MLARASKSLLLGLIVGLLAVACAVGIRPNNSSAFDDDGGQDAAPPPTPMVDVDASDDSTPPIALDDAPSESSESACAFAACAEASVAICGDGIIQPGEGCDDGNTASGDGCSSTCQIEPGYACPTPGQPCAPVQVCGNGLLDAGEQCDDDNMLSGDGCSSTCQIEPGWQCPILGSRCIAKQCGDGILAGSEQCDDGNILPGDGCSATCQIEAGYACVAPITPPPSSVCHRTVCGDGIKEGFEQCDDGNLIPYDGCSPSCTIEPKCNGMGGCTGVCGDGLVFPGEQCDDGNTKSGDGCSSTCQIEPGFTCTNIAQPPASTLVLPILYRDMLYWNTASFPAPAPVGGGHPDFQRYNGAVVPGLVQSTLGADNEPVWASNGPAGNPKLAGPVEYCWWYHEVGCGLGDAGAGDAAAGDASASNTNPYAKLVYLDGTGQPTTLTLAQQAPGSNAYSYASTGAGFFPLDGLGWNAGTNPQLGAACDGTMHNFSFTSELHYLFTYQASVAATAPAVFMFTGDDDVWAFINGQLVVDLGGVHNAATQNVTLSTAVGAALHLTDGGWYSIDLFQAERHTCASNYALGLSGFVHTISQCQATCGDGVVGGTEQCDRGSKNVPAATAYGAGICTTNCMLAPYCGDAVVEAQFGEQCDDGTNLATYGGSSSMVCGPGCKWAPYCGDGIVQSPEQCDNGSNNVPPATAYGPGVCVTDCSAAPYCGDGILQPQFGEQCDGTAGCTAQCQKAQ